MSALTLTLTLINRTRVRWAWERPEREGRVTGGGAREKEEREPGLRVGGVREECEIRRSVRGAHYSTKNIITIMIKKKVRTKNENKENTH